MKFIQKNKTVIIIMILVAAFYGFSARSQYSWANKFKSEVGSDWIIFDEQSNAFDPIYPYTIIYPPVDRLGLIQKSSISKLDNGAFTYITMWSDGPIGNRMPTQTFVSFDNCNKHLEGFLKKGIQSFTNLDDVEWYSPRDEPFYLTNKDEKDRSDKMFNVRCKILTQLYLKK